MNRTQKSALVEDLAQRFAGASIVLVSEYKGLTAGESTEFRRRLRAARAEFRIAKNTLVKRAVADTRLAPLEEHLGGPVGVIVSFADPVAAAKTVTEFRDAGDKLKLRGGVLDGRAISREEVVALANLPPRPVVMAQLLGLIQAPASRLVRLLNEPGSSLARLMDAIAKRSGGGAAEAEAEAE